jgi:hypothetical protein
VSQLLFATVSVTTVVALSTTTLKLEIQEAIKMKQIQRRKFGVDLIILFVS